MQGCGPRTAFPGPAYGQAQQQQQYGAASCRRYDYIDIDQEDADDPMACTEYVNDIFEYLRESEVRCRGVGSVAHHHAAAAAECLWAGKELGGTCAKARDRF